MWLHFPLYEMRKEKLSAFFLLTKIKSIQALNKNNNNIQEQQENRDKKKENCSNEMVGEENDGVELR